MNQSGSSLTPLKLFISYSQTDDDLRKQLEDIHLSLLKRQGKIQSWSKGAIDPGVEWEEATTQALEAAKIILLLISPDFMADNCHGHELQKALQRHQEGIARVIPVILRPTYLEDTPFSSLQPLPSNAKPVTTWSNRDEAFLDVVKGLHLVVQSLQEPYRSVQFPQEIDTNIVWKKNNFDELIQQVRGHCRQKILNQHSRMRLLNGEEIGVDQLYVDVYLLAKPEHKHFNSPENLLRSFNIEKDRLALSKRIQRNPGFEVANAKSKLVILGKPGSGKTTFLKHLAVDWCNEKFQPELIAILIELRQIRDEKWNLLNAVDKELGLNNWHQFSTLRNRIPELKVEILELETEIQNLKHQKIQEHNEEYKRKIERQIIESTQQLGSLTLQILEFEKYLESLPLQCFLKQGKLLVLMDGLDEVHTKALRGKVQEQLLQASDDYCNNRFILTCRTQIIGSSVPGAFTSVEVADFSPEQVGQFVQNWFKASGESYAKAKEQWKKMRTAIVNKPDLKELTVTPVLLSLMCLVLQDEGEIPSNRAWLYKKGIKLLLNRWNDEKQIDDWEVGTETYRKLSIEDKEALLIEIAASKFENPKNFILFEQKELADHIAHRLQLADFRERIAVLRAIEAQHGLLIERADELWSFSHLTFQEHFTVQWLTQLPSKELTEKIANQQWQEVVTQLVKSQQPADQLLRLIKQAIDRLIARESAMQTFLNWLFQKSKSAQVNYNPTAIRAFYYALARDRALARGRALARDLVLDRVLARALALDCTPTIPCAHAFELALNLALELDRHRIHAHALALAHTLDPDLTNKLQQLKMALPTANNWESFYPWWQANGSKWIEQLRQVMNEYRTIGHDWQFTDEQRQQLKLYYDANKFLVDLMNIEGAVSKDVRAEIEDTLLLPWAELQRRQPGIYRDLE